VALGLKPEVARLLAEQTMYGTAKFLRESGMELKPFIDGVCTKGGTTAAGMKKLATPNFKRIVAATLKAAAKRSAELAALAVMMFASGAVIAEDSKGLEFDAGADLRIRQELMENVPGMPGGGVLNSAVRTEFRNHMRFRPRVWGEFAGDAGEAGQWRIYTRLTDEFRWCPEPYANKNTFPDEVILDNLFVEGKGIFDGKLDLRIGRQDLMGYCGLNHVFVDGTPGDGSRTVYSDMAAFKWHVDEKSTLDLFALYNFDDNILRWGTDRGKHRSMTGLGGGAEPEMDDWGFGLIWSSELSPVLPYQLFAIQKNTMEFERRGVLHPWTQRELIGTKVVPQLNEEWSLQLEGMGQVGCNGDSDTLSGWSSYAGVNWKSAAKCTVRPFGRFGYHFMSGDDDAATEDGGHSAWDPMWARGVNDAEMFLYGTHYGAAWWSNMHYAKLTGGLDLGRSHRLTGSCGPMFAAAQDGLGGGNGMFKGFLYQGRYDFPLWLADKDHGERFEVIGHAVAEFMNPGNYFETEKPAWFFRWQVEMKF